MARAVATQQHLRLALLLLPAVLSQDDDAGGEGGDEPAGPLSIQSSATAADGNAAVQLLPGHYVLLAVCAISGSIAIALVLRSLYQYILARLPPSNPHTPVRVPGKVATLKAMAIDAHQAQLPRDDWAAGRYSELGSYTYAQPAIAFPSEPGRRAPALIDHGPASMSGGGLLPVQEAQSRFHLQSASPFVR